MAHWGTYFICLGVDIITQGLGVPFGTLAKCALAQQHDGLMIKVQLRN